MLSKIKLVNFILFFLYEDSRIDALVFCNLAKEQVDLVPEQDQTN